MNTIIEVERYHDFCAGHRVVGHEGKCKNLHGHNYRVHFTVSAAHLDDVGRVIDFSVIKERLCQWLEENWDHKMIIWNADPLFKQIKFIDPTVVPVSFNPTAENLGLYILEVVAPLVLEGTGARLTAIRIEETRKCSAIVKII